MRKLETCGVIVMRKLPRISFLLMLKHPGSKNIYDVPKGRTEIYEDQVSCALRELFEETGITVKDIDLDPNFRYSNTAQTSYKRFKDEKVEKKLVMFLGWLKYDVDLKLTEHSGYKWVDWHPPHTIQDKMINPLLAQLEKYLAV